VSLNKGATLRKKLPGWRSHVEKLNIEVRVSPTLHHMPLSYRTPGQLLLITQHPTKLLRASCTNEASVITSLLRKGAQVDAKVSDSRQSCQTKI
jgi:hypothetical protein